jgi:hypothetical protein
MIPKDTDGAPLLDPADDFIGIRTVTHDIAKAKDRSRADLTCYRLDRFKIRMKVGNEIQPQRASNTINAKLGGLNHPST